MSTYFIGDVHGHYNELISLLDQVKFIPGQDILWLTGDLVSRGPDSLKVLRYVKNLGNNARIVLGNHEIHLLSVYFGIKEDNPKDRITSLLKNTNIDKLINWLRQQPLMQVDEKKHLIMLHAGIIPQWDLKTAKSCAHDVETALVNDFFCPIFLDAIKNNVTNNNYWSEKLSFWERLCFVTNVFTRIRYCFPNGTLEMCYKNTPPSPYLLSKPWFDFPQKISQKYSIVFGHWASLSSKNTPQNIYALDTGCCWNGKLTCLRWEDKKYFSCPCEC